MYCFLEGLQLYNGLGAAAFLPWPLVLDEPEGQNPEVKKHTDPFEKALTGTTAAAAAATAAATTTAAAAATTTTVPGKKQT